MDAKILKYISVLFCFIFDSGHLRESFVDACRFPEECLADEFCDESNRCIKKLLARDFILSESPLYQRNNPQERWSDEGYDLYERNYNENYLKNNRLRQIQQEDWESDGNNYEYESRNLRHLAQSEDSFGSRHGQALQQLRSSDEGHGPLPPVKHRVNLLSSVEENPRGYNERDFYNVVKGYNERLPAKRRLRQRDESSVDGVNDVQGNQGSSHSNDHFLLVKNAGMVHRRMQDFDSSEQSQRLPNSEAIKVKSVADESLSVKRFSDNERGVPPVPLEQEEKPNLADSSRGIGSFHGNQLQTEKQALMEDAADVNSSGPAAKGKVMVKGKVQQIKDKIDQGPNPEKTYQRVEDFFESQRESSIVEVPNAVKKEEATKLFKENFIPVKENSMDVVSKEQAASPKLMKGDITLSLNKNISTTEAKMLAAALQNALWINAPSSMFTVLKLNDAKVKLKMARTDYTQEDTKDVVERIRKEPSIRGDVARSSGLQIVEADYEDTPSKDVRGQHPKRSVETRQPKYFLITIVVVGCVTGVVLTAVAIYLVMKRYNETKNFRPVTLPGQEAAADYQELCRQLRATQGWDSGPVKSTHPQKSEASGRAPKYSWSEEPVVPNMDISTGHVVLAYMEDHLNNKDRLNKEWEALKTYEAEPNSREIGKLEKNAMKNRYSDVLPYDHNRVLLKETASATGSDYVNASYITDHDPKNPAYIATQGPLAHTVSDFWQMVWEQGVVVMVNLTKLSDLGLPQCHRYWPEDGQPIITYRIYEVHLVSEHIWCEDYLVRSFYLKNLQTSETRTVTQFHFLSWPDLNVPSTPKPLLEFRRKVNKCFRGRASPVVVHCSGGVGRTGTYILIDMVLNKMMRGAKEIDIAATVEHLRDQRPFMVKTKAQFEFALTAVAEEVNAILQALSK